MNLSMTTCLAWALLLVGCGGAESSKLASTSSTILYDHVFEFFVDPKYPNLSGDVVSDSGRRSLYYQCNPDRDRYRALSDHDRIDHDLSPLVGNIIVETPRNSQQIDRVFVQLYEHDDAAFELYRSSLEKIRSHRGVASAAAHTLGVSTKFLGIDRRYEGSDSRTVNLGDERPAALRLQIRERNHAIAVVVDLLDGDGRDSGSLEVVEWQLD